MSIKNETSLASEIHFHIKDKMARDFFIPYRWVFTPIQYLEGDTNIRHLFFNSFIPDSFPILFIQIIYLSYYSWYLHTILMGQMGTCFGFAHDFTSLT